jgi:Fe-S cluster biogenesis protein NfuA
MFIQTEETPNPSTLKFITGEDVSPRKTKEYKSPEDAKNSPLATRLFEVDGVIGVFLGDDFISITKSDISWEMLKPAVLGAIMDHHTSDEPILIEDTDGKIKKEEDSSVVKEIKKIIHTRIQPAVAQDGGAVEFEGYRDNIVYVRLQGACSGCPSATQTLKNGIENLICHFVPEVKEVKQI